VDPVSHAAFGRTLAALDARGRLGAGATTACVLGALCPDLDIARTFQGWDVYLVHHQGGTHSLPGAVACGILTGTVVRACAPRRGRWLPLVAAATVGALSHVLLDVLSGADVRLFAPVWSRVFSLPLFAMADPWLLGILVIAAAVSSIPLPHGRPERLRYGGIALALITLLVALKGGLYLRASSIERHAAERGAARHVEAVFGSLTRWHVIEVYPATLDWWDVDVRSRRALRLASVARGLDVPLVQQSSALPTVANLLASHDDTFARVVEGAGGASEVRWSALRYCRVERTGSDPVCGLWFGGEYDARGRPTAAVMRIGSIVQRRSPAPAASDHE
jgi:membrane-bound metal-dependent hydrolase YbcI (DUF457 family)